MDTNQSKDVAIRKHVARSTASNLVGQAVILGVGFLLSPFVLHRVGASDYGLWIVITSLTGYASVLEFGISSAVIKYVSEYRARGEIDHAGDLVATALSLYTILGLLAIAFSAGIALLLPNLIRVAPEDTERAITLVLLAGVGLGISIPATTVVAVLRGLQRFDLLNLLYIINTLLSASATIAVVLLGWGIVGVAAAAIPVTIVSQIPGLWLIRRADPTLRLGWRGARRNLVRTVTSFSVSLFAIQIARQLISRSDELIIATSLPISAVTPYSFGRRLGEMPNLIANQFIRTLMPLVSGLHAVDDWLRLRALFLSSTRLALALSTAIAVVLSVLGSSLLTLWIGVEYAGAWPIVLVIGASSVVMISLYPAGALLQGIARHRILAVTSIATGIINVGLSFFLVRRVGVLGVALGTLVPAALEGLVVMPYTMRLLKLSWSSLLRESLLPAITPAVPMIGVMLVARQLAPPATWFGVVAVAVLGGLTYALGYFAFRVAAPEREMVWGFMRRGIRLMRTGG